MLLWEERTASCADRGGIKDYFFFFLCVSNHRYIGSRAGGTGERMGRLRGRFSNAWSNKNDSGRWSNTGSTRIRAQRLSRENLSKLPNLSSISPFYCDKPD